MEENLLIFYLSANDRHFVFTKFIDELLKSDYKDQITLLIVNSTPDSTFYDSYLKNVDLQYHFSYVPCPQDNYLPKVRHAIDYAKMNGYKYILKYDNDIIMPIYTLDFILNNLNKLDDDNVATISPTITTGIPSVEYFIDDFIDSDTAMLIREEFKKCVFHVQPNVMDYRPLNICTIEKKEKWDCRYYFDTMNEYIDSLPDNGGGRTYNNFCKFYKGIHPIRHGFGNKLINDYIINNKVKFFEKKQCSFIKDTSPYLCDMCFVIKTVNYDALINKENLIVDGCDEVPVNRFAWNHNKKHYIIKGGYTIHITYNWRWSLNNIYGGSNIDKPDITLDEYEENFINAVYDTN